MEVAVARPKFRKIATDLGRYWISSLPRRALLDHLRGCRRDFLKAADVGGSTESDFEQSFASLAYSYIKDKAPRLLDFIIGFQLVERNEDETKAVGVFGFKVGNLWLYVPAVFLNGDLKGHEILWIKNQDLIVPCKENWVNHVISRKPHVLGGPSPKNPYELGQILPDLSRLAHPPTASKYGSDQGYWRPQIEDWAKPALPFLAAVATWSDKLWTKHAGLNERLDLHNQLANFPMLAAAYRGCYRRFPGIKAAFDKLYGPDFFLKMGQQLKVNAESLLGDHRRNQAVAEKQAEAEAARKLAAEARRDSLMPVKEEPLHPLKSGALEIISVDLDVDMDEAGTITRNLPKMTDEEQAKLLRDRVLIKDKRDPHATSMAYNTQVTLRLTNPTESGIYETLEKPGTFNDMLIISHPHSGRGHEGFALAIRTANPKSWINTHHTNLWVKPAESMEKFRKFVEDLPDTKTLKKGGTYVALNDYGSGTCPFTIKEVFADGVYEVCWEDHAQYGKDRPAFLPSASRHHYGIGYGNYDYRDYDSYRAKLCVSERPGTKIVVNNYEVSLPRDCKILKIEDPPPPPKPKSRYRDEGPSELSFRDYRSKTEKIEPGNLGDVQVLLHKSAATVKIHDTGAGEVYITTDGKGGRLSKRAALLHLVRDQGLAEYQARVMLKEAAAASVMNKAVSYFVKHAAGFGGGIGGNLFPGPTAPNWPNPPLGMEMAGPNAYPAIYPDEQFMPVAGMQANLADAQIYDPFYFPDRKVMQVAQQAADSGYKEVFDTSMVSGLLKSMAKPDLVKSSLSDLIKANDKIGRNLLLFYWHQDDFADRYGKDKLPELEDALRNTFDAQGDLVLFLMEREVGSSIDGAFGGINKSDPSIDEVANN
jgi:hypothetical protein